MKKIIFLFYMILTQLVSSQALEARVFEKVNLLIQESIIPQNDSIVHWQKLAQFYKEKEEWTKANFFYEKILAQSEDPESLIALYQISQKEGKVFDFNRFLQSQNSYHLKDYALFFNLKEADEKTEKLAKKSLALEFDTQLQLLLFSLSKKRGEPDINLLLDSEDMDVLADFSLRLLVKSQEGHDYKERKKYCQWAVQLGEKVLSKDGIGIYNMAAAQNYNSLGWYQLLTGEFEAAYKSIQRGLELDDVNLYLYTNRPAILLLLKGYEAAKPDYLKWKDKPFNNTYPTFKEAFLADLDTFEKEGIIPSERAADVTKIRTLLEGEK